MEESETTQVDTLTRVVGDDSTSLQIPYQEDWYTTIQWSSYIKTQECKETCQLCKDSRTVITLSSMEQVKFLFGTETEELGRKRNNFGGRHSHSTNLLEKETRSTELQIFEYSNSTRCGRLGLGRLQRGNALSFRHLLTYIFWLRVVVTNGVACICSAML